MNAPTHDRTFWSLAYSNSAFIEGGDRFPDQWHSDAADFRAKFKDQACLDLLYGDDPRERFDLFVPVVPRQGTLVFVHGGYWMAFDKSFWSHFAEGALTRGWAVAMPSYNLCPDVRISDITQQIGRAITHIATQNPGPLRLAGHSAGGHLVTRMICSDSPLPADILANLHMTMAISGLHDLRPLCVTDLNDTLHLGEDEAIRESPALLRPKAGQKIICWVGAEERPEFLRQNALLANIWSGLGAETSEHQRAGLHHFNVLDDLRDPDSAMVINLLAPLDP